MISKGIHCVETASQFLATASGSSSDSVRNFDDDVRSSRLKRSLERISKKRTKNMPKRPPKQGHEMEKSYDKTKSRQSQV
ncbi:hypothetical protein Tco_1485735 [Tanacetum coccineum]